MKNSILIKHNSNWGVDEFLVQKKTELILKKFGFNEDVELSILFVGRKKAKELNIKYRQMTYIPQVLSFPLDRKKNADGMVRLGDIVICNEKLKYESKFQNKSIEQILEEWIEHGIEGLLI